MAVFSPIKKFYCIKLLKYPDDYDSSLIRKRIFLKCYIVARKHSIIKKNILTSWFSSGMWLVNRVKLLISPLLFIKVLIVVSITLKKA